MPEAALGYYDNGNPNRTRIDHRQWAIDRALKLAEQNKLVMGPSDIVERAKTIEAYLYETKPEPEPAAKPEPAGDFPCCQAPCGHHRPRLRDIT